jgi:hypothetical protein
MNSYYDWKSTIYQTCDEMIERNPENKGSIKMFGLLGSILVDLFNKENKENKDIYNKDNENEKKEEKEEKIDENDIRKNECSICLQTMKIEISLPCGHVKFHKKCISNMITMKCPICRAPFNKITNLYV